MNELHLAVAGTVVSMSGVLFVAYSLLQLFLFNLGAALGAIFVAILLALVAVAILELSRKP